MILFDTSVIIHGIHRVPGMVGLKRALLGLHPEKEQG